MKQKTLEWAGPSSSFCDGEPPETHSNLPIGFITLPSEPAMNAAGRTSDHPFKDPRSARRTHHRSKTHSARIASCNKRRRSDKGRPAKVSPPKDTFQQIATQERECSQYAKWAHKADLERMDAITAYHLFGKNAAIFNSTDNNETILSEGLPLLGPPPHRRDAARKKESRIHRYGKTDQPVTNTHPSHTPCAPLRIEVVLAPPSSPRPKHNPMKQHCLPPFLISALTSH